MKHLKNVSLVNIWIPVKDLRELNTENSLYLFIYLFICLLIYIFIYLFTLMVTCHLKLMNVMLSAHMCQLHWIWELGLCPIPVRAHTLLLSQNFLFFWCNCCPWWRAPAASILPSDRSSCVLACVGQLSVTTAGCSWYVIEEGLLHQECLGHFGSCSF